MTDYLEYERQQHAHAALRLAEQLGLDRAAESYEAILGAYAIALAAITSRDNAVEVFSAAMAQFAPVKSVPRLIVDNDQIAG